MAEDKAAYTQKGHCVGHKAQNHLKQLKEILGDERADPLFQMKPLAAPGECIKRFVKEDQKNGQYNPDEDGDTEIKTLSEKGT